MKKILLFIFLIPAVLFGQTYTWTVKAVHDGDTYKVEQVQHEWAPAGDTGFVHTETKTVFWVRIEGVGTPELYWPGHITETQPLGREVADSVRWLIKGQRVTLDLYGVDQYGRKLARITLLDGRDLAEVILSRGWGWYQRNDLPVKTKRRYQRIRDKARDATLGVHGIPGMVTDKVWRQTHRPGGA